MNNLEARVKLIIGKRFSKQLSYFKIAFSCVKGSDINKCNESHLLNQQKKAPASDLKFE